MKLELNQIRANPWNCNYLGEQEQQALKQRILEEDPETMEPLMVRSMPDGGYELVDGEHRWRIAQELGWTEIDVKVLETVDDLTARTRCISSSILRGHVNWFKLAEVVKNDFDAGVDLTEAYKDILSAKMIQELFSLDNLVPKARLDLEEAVKKFSTIPLADLHLLSQFPAHLQEELAEEYKNHPISSHSLACTLNKYSKQTQPTFTTTTNPYLHGEIKDQESSLVEKFDDKPWSPNEALRRWNALKQQQQRLDGSSEDAQTNVQKEDGLGSCGDSVGGVSSGGGVRGFAGLGEVQRALMLAVGYPCVCGRLYRVHFRDRVYLKNFDVVVQKENEICEHVDFRPRVFLVHCDGCIAT